MSSHVDQPPVAVALLSIASSAATTDNSTFAEIAGRPMLEWQMLAFKHAGVRQFLVEVDSVPGALLDLADKFRRNDIDVQFVRNIKDVQALLVPQTSLVLVAEAHHFSSDWVAAILNAST
jgi:hypothetical protein